MKKIFSISLATMLILSLSISAFAQVQVNGQDYNEQIVENAEYIFANAATDSLTVLGNVTGNEENHSVNAQNNSEIIVCGNVVSESKISYAIYASEGAKVTAGSVTSIGPYSIFADDSLVRVNGDVENIGTGVAIFSDNNATVVVDGNVAANTKSSTINTFAGNAVVSGNVCNQDDNTAVFVGPENFVLVENTVTGRVVSSGGQIYLGVLDGTVVGNPDHVHYLIGSKEGVLVTGIVGDGTISGVEKDGIAKTYSYTFTSLGTTLEGATITLSPKDNNKTISIEGALPTGVTANVANGVVTLTFSNSFEGGLQTLDQLLKLVSKDNTGIAADIYLQQVLANAKTRSITIPNDLPEGLVVVYDRDGHVGISVDKFLLDKGFVKVYKNGKELPVSSYSVYNHKDGSISIIMSNTYLETLNTGSYNFTAQVDGQEIGFTVLVTNI